MTSSPAPLPAAPPDLGLVSDSRGEAHYIRSAGRAYSAARDLAAVSGCGLGAPVGCRSGGWRRFQPARV